MLIAVMLVTPLNVVFAIGVLAYVLAGGRPPVWLPVVSLLVSGILIGYWFLRR